MALKATQLTKELCTVTDGENICTADLLSSPFPNLQFSDQQILDYIQSCSVHDIIDKAAKILIISVESLYGVHMAD